MLDWLNSEVKSFKSSGCLLTVGGPQVGNFGFTTSGTCRAFLGKADARKKIYIPQPLPHCHSPEVYR